MGEVELRPATLDVGVFIEHDGPEGLPYPQCSELPLTTARALGAIFAGLPKDRDRGDKHRDRVSAGPPTQSATGPARVEGLKVRCGPLPPATVHLEARDRGPASPTSTAPASAVAAAAVANAVALPNRSQSTPNSSAPGSTSSPAVR